MSSARSGTIVTLSVSRSVGSIRGKEIGAVSLGDVVIFFRKREHRFEPAVHWVFAEDIEASYNELKSSGANVVEPLEEKSWGLRQFTVDDLDGNRFYFHHD